MRGRKPKPTICKIREGVRGSRINFDEPKPPAGRPECPGHLPASAREEWSRISDILESMGLLSPAEAPVLVIYCEAYAKWLAARADIAKRGLTIEVTKTVTSKRGATIETTGRVVANPSVNIEIQMMRLMKECLTEMGLTPSSRSRVKGGNNPHQDRLAAFLAGRKKEA